MNNLLGQYENNKRINHEQEQIMKTSPISLIDCRLVGWLSDYRLSAMPVMAWRGIAEMA